MDDTARRVGAQDLPAGRAAGADDEDVAKRTSEIRQEIEQTREEMSETIDAIQEKLTPRNIVASATDKVKAATTEKVRAMTGSAAETAEDAMEYTRDAAGGVMETVRDNPIPAALIGLGAAWLLMKRSDSGRSSWPDRNAARLGYRGGNGSKTRYNSESRYEPIGEYDPSEYDTRSGYGAGEGYSDRWSDARYRTGEESGGVLDRVREHPVPAALATIGLSWLAFAGEDRNRGRTRSYGSGYSYRETSAYGTGSSTGARWTEADDNESDSLTGKASDVASSASGSAERIASRATEYAGDTADAMRRTGRRAQNGFERMLRDNPLLVGVGALVLGAAVGLAVPETERENEWMGEAREDVVNRAQEAARNAVSQVQNAVGGAVVNAASEAITGKSE
jgi:hypothetical protein